MSQMNGNHSAVNLTDLAKLPRWVAWQTEGRGAKGKPTKVPYNPMTGRKAMADSPRTWGARAAAEKLAPELPRPFDIGGVGLELGDHEGVAIGGIDLDTCLDAEAKLAPWADLVMQRFATYAETSPSGTGVKLFFTYDPADAPALRKTMGTQTGKKWCQRSGDDHPPGIELYISGRFFAVTDRQYPGAPAELRQVSRADLEWLILDVGPKLATPPEPKAAPAPAPAAKIRKALQQTSSGDSSRSASAFKVACRVKRRGGDYEAFLEALDANTETADWKAEKGEADGGRELHRAWERAGDPQDAGKPRLLLEAHNPDRTVLALRDILAGTGRIFDRGVPVRLTFDQMQHGMVAKPMTPDATVLEAHRACRPYILKEKDGDLEEVSARLPRTTAVMYLDSHEWNLPVLNGIASAPLLHEDGSIHAADGYDASTGLWCENVPDLSGLVPERPTRDQAATALLTLRTTFRTFPFADAVMIQPEAMPVPVVDTSLPPAADESGFLVGLMTAAARSSLHLAPGMLLTAAPMSGAGAGKGLLARCTCAIAFGRAPHAVTSGATAEETEKRIATELMEGAPTLFLDNLNNQAFKSDLLASAITERPARVRLLGKSQSVPLNATAFIVLTGNGLTVSEDLARRFVTVALDPRTEDPEARAFTGDLLTDVIARRAELLASLLTIWRWGRQAGETLKPGRALGSFGQWGRWVRDPLLALCCQDPAERIGEAKTRDQRRVRVAELFSVWWDKHRDYAMQAKDLHEEVRALLDPQNRGRQFQAAELGRMDGTRIAGLVMTRVKSTARWSVATYALQKAPEERRTPYASSPMPPGGSVEPAPRKNGKKPDFIGSAEGRDPMPPMTPMPTPPRARIPGNWSSTL
jgi:hypothetical protein